MTHQNLSPKSADRANSLLKAARRLFVQKGFEGMSLDHVIAETGGSRRNIYALFGGKEGLLEAVIEQIIEDIASRILSKADETAVQPIEERLAGLGVMLNEALLHPDVIAVIRQVITRSTGGIDLNTFWQKGPERVTAKIADTLMQADEDGILRVPNPKDSAMVLRDMLHGPFLIEALIGRSTHVSQKVLQDHATRAVGLFLKAHAI